MQEVQPGESGASNYYVDIWHIEIWSIDIWSIDIWHIDIRFLRTKLL